MITSCDSISVQFGTYLYKGLSINCWGLTAIQELLTSTFMVLEGIFMR